MGHGKLMPRFKPRVYFDEDGGTPRDQEERVAKKVGGKRVAGSGASDYSKGDVRLDRFLIECKKSEKLSLRIKQEWLKKISNEARAKEKWPALSIEIQGESDLLTEKDWVLVPLSVFRVFVDAV